MVATIPFFGSLVLLGICAGLHLVEQKRGRRFFDNVRRRWDQRLSQLYEAAVTGTIPTEWRAAALAALHAVSHSLVVLVVEVLRAVERPLARLSHKMRMQGPYVANGKEVSPFLKTITPEKKNGNGTHSEPL